MSSTNTTHYTAPRSPTFRTKPLTFRSYTSIKTPRRSAIPFKGWFSHFLNQITVVGKWSAVRRFGNVERIGIVSTRANVPRTKGTVDLRLLLFSKCSILTGVYVVSTHENHPAPFPYDPQWTLENAEWILCNCYDFTAKWNEILQGILPFLTRNFIELIKFINRYHSSIVIL